MPYIELDLMDNSFDQNLVLKLLTVLYYMYSYCILFGVLVVNVGQSSSYNWLKFYLAHCVYDWHLVIYYR